jgi:hypothetical protein
MIHDTGDFRIEVVPVSGSNPRRDRPRGRAVRVDAMTETKIIHIHRAG